MTLTALGFKTVTIWGLLMLFSLSFGPPPFQGLVIAVVTAVLSWLADKALPFKVQGITRWAIDSGLIAISIWLGQFLWPGMRIAFYSALFLGFVIGAIEIPLHFWLAKRFGLGKPDEWKGVR